MITPLPTLMTRFVFKPVSAGASAVPMKRPIATNHVTAKYAFSALPIRFTTFCGNNSEVDSNALAVVGRVSPLPAVLLQLSSARGGVTDICNLVYRRTAFCGEFGLVDVFGDPAVVGRITPCAPLACNRTAGRGLTRPTCPRLFRVAFLRATLNTFGATALFRRVIMVVARLLTVPPWPGPESNLPGKGRPTRPPRRNHRRPSGPPAVSRHPTARNWETSVPRPDARRRRGIFPTRRRQCLL